jgi:hypothetical protein
MARKLKALAKYEDWKAPWEVNADGEDIPAEEQEFDAQRARKRIYDLLADRNRAQDTVAEVTERAEQLEAKLAEAADPKALEDLQKEAQKAREDAEKAKSGGNVLALKYEVALDKGLTKSQARRLIGETREDLEADAEELLETFGGKGKRSNKDDDDNDDDGPTPRRGPRSRFVNPGDPDPDKDLDKEKPLDPDEVYKRYKNLQ